MRFRTRKRSVTRWSRCLPVLLAPAALAGTALWGPACAPEEESSSASSQECQDLCTALVTDCGYGAFPDFESCLQGCAWDESEGADIAGELQCVEQAACDTFAIVECEHTYGLDD